MEVNPNDEMTVEVSAEQRANWVTQLSCFCFHSAFLPLTISAPSPSPGPEPRPPSPGAISRPRELPRVRLRCRRLFWQPLWHL